MDEAIRRAYVAPAAMAAATMGSHFCTISALLALPLFVIYWL